MDHGSDSIVLNVYELPMAPQEGQGREQSSSTASTTNNSSNGGSWTNGITSLFSNLLPRAGLGAYHTSIDVNGYCYTYGMGGIAKTSIANKHAHLPPNVTFQQSINLGSTRLGSSHGGRNSAINQCIQTLRREYFTESGYHVVHRNCNHFTETLAMALIVAEDLMREDPPPELKTYPKWINRLAKTGSSLMKNSDKSTKEKSSSSAASQLSICNVVQEARAATGLEGKVSWDLTSSSSRKNASKSSQSKSKKKELTEAQKKVLAKLNRK